MKNILHVIDRELWIEWQIKFVKSLKHDSEKYGWSFDLLKRALSKEFPRSNMVHVLGMKRSGNHAIVNWMIKNCFESQVFFNNIVSYDADRVKVSNVQFISPDLIDRVICTFEHISLDFFEGDEDFWYVIRDPYNWLASWINHSHFNESTVENDILTYIQNAKSTQKKILYNEWFKSRSYRDDLAIKLGFINKDIAINEVPKFGKGSSFDREQYEGRASEMDVLNRWKKVANNSLYLQLIRQNYEDLEDIAKHVFNMTCPVEILE